MDVGRDGSHYHPFASICFWIAANEWIPIHERGLPVRNNGGSELMSASRMGAAVARRLQLPPERKKQLLALAGISHSANSFDPENQPRRLSFRNDI